MKKKTDTQYNFINIIILFITAILFVTNYGNVSSVFQGTDLRHIGIIIVTVFLVHLIKAARLYLILFGSDLSFREYLKVYCKVIPVSVVWPFKLGEFFRMYCYGKLLSNLLKGIVVVLLDRFMDTFALVIMIILIWVINGGEITSLVYILLLFLVLALMLYFAFPGLYKFFKKTILRAKATENKLKVLKVLDVSNNVYEEISDVSKGRAIILLVMSLIAWAVEIGSLVLLNGVNGSDGLGSTISGYLSAAIGSGKSAELLHFVFVSVVMTIAIYIVAKLSELTLGKKEQY